MITKYFRYTFSFAQKFCSRTVPFLTSPPTPHYPSPSSSLGSLAKGSWLAARLACFSNTPILRDTYNVQISQTLSAVKTEGSSASIASTSANTANPALSLAPHYPKSKSTASGGHHNYSLFIIHYSLNKKSAPFQTTDLDIKFQCKIKVCRPPVT